jgi:hypothetical protein
VTEFRKIEKYPGYWADSEGNIWSSKRQVGRKDGKGTDTVIEEKPLRKFSPSMNHWGYLNATIRNDGKQKTIRVHTLVLLAFHGPKPFDNAVCRHLDGNKLNNRPQNLKWGTAKENAQDMIEHGLLGVGDFNTNFTEKDIIDIRNTKYYHGLFNDLAKKYDVEPSTIASVYYGTRWQHISGANQPRIDEAAVRDIRSREYYRGLFRDLAEEYDITVSNASLIYKGKTWKHVGTDKEKPIYHHRNTKLDEEKVRDIRSREKHPHLVKELMEEFGVGKTTIQSALNGTTWKHVK